jgi:DNA polymerase III epsilon subunit-like protein
MWRRLLDLLATCRRPLVFVDFETSGLSGAPPVEFAVLVYSPWEAPVDDEETRRVAPLVPPGLTYALQMRLDPLRPIDPGATRVHRIRDEDVRGKATAFNDLEVVGFFQGYASGDAADSVGPAVWCGHNAAGADAPWARRWGYLPDDDLDVVDTMRIVRRMQREMPFPLAHDVLTPVASGLGGEVSDGCVSCTYTGLDAYASSLVGAHVALCGDRPAESHGAMADCVSTARVLCRLLDLWSPMWPPGRIDLPASANLSSLLAALDAPEPGRVSWDGWLAEDEAAPQPGQRALPGGQARYVWAKGKHRGEPAETDPSYRQWVTTALPRRPSGNDGEAWCSQHTADILGSLRPVAVAR